MKQFTEKIHQINLVILNIFLIKNNRLTLVYANPKWRADRISVPLILLFLSAITPNLFAQDKEGALLELPANVKVNGKLDEWGDNLSFYNADAKLNYVLANDAYNLYIAIKFDSRMQQTQVLNAGLSISINPKGKKKKVFSLTYPYLENTTITPTTMAGLRAHFKDNTGTSADREALMGAMLTKLNKIKATGFKDLESDILRINNTYGIKVALAYDSNGNLIYEASIPIKLFNENQPTGNAWAFNIRINGLTPPAQGGSDAAASGGGRRGGGGGGGGGRGRRGGNGDQSGAVDRAELFKSIDFWQKLKINY